MPVERDYNPKLTILTAAETGVDPELVKEIWNCAIKTVVDEITSEELNTIRLPHLGKFTPNYRYMRHKGIESLIPKPDNGSTKSL